MPVLDRLKRFLKRHLTVASVHGRNRNFWCDSKHWAYCMVCKRIQDAFGIAHQPVKDQIMVNTVWGGYILQRLRGPGGCLTYHYKYFQGWEPGEHKRIPFDILLNGQTIRLEVDFRAS
jgi:hypothetical protein